MQVMHASIRPATAAQSHLKADREHCSVDRVILSRLGVAKGDQVRIVTDAGQWALYTIGEIHSERRPATARSGPNGLARLAATGPFDGRLDSQIARSELTDCQAETAGELVERLDDVGHQRRLVVLAPHGGRIEVHTDDQAEHLATVLDAAVSADSSRVTCWRAKGWRPGGGASERWHIRSTDLAFASFPLLGSLAARGFDHAVAFHGYQGDEVLIGGADRDLRSEVCRSVSRALTPTGINVRLATAADGLNGDNPANIVNRLTASGVGGVQLEQSLTARTKHWRLIAQAVADVYQRHLGARG